MADGDAYEVDPSPIASERGHQGVVLVGFFLQLLVAAEVPAEADLEEGEGAVLAVEGVNFRDGSASTPRAYMMSGAAPVTAAIRLSRSSCGSTHAGMYRGELSAFFVVYHRFPL